MKMQFLENGVDYLRPSFEVISAELGTTRLGEGTPLAMGGDSNTPLTVRLERPRILDSRNWRRLRRER
jgi:hypothetical protein